MRNYGWFQIAERLGKSLDEVMEAHTDRQMVMWQLYFRERDKEELKEPSKTENYIMRVAYEVRVLSERVRTLFGGKMTEPKFEEFKVKFLTEEPKPLDPKKAAEWSKQIWTAATHSGKVQTVHKRMSRAEAARAVEETAKEYREWLEKSS